MRVMKMKHLDNLNINDVFERCLETFDVFPEVRIELTGSYNEIIKDLQEDKNAE
jgi:exonuclease SbcD